MRGRGDKCINMRVLKADVSWGWGICSVICSFRRHLSLGVRALLQEVCNNPPPTPPQPSGRGGRSRRGHRGRVPGRRRPPAQRFLARVGGGTGGRGTTGLPGPRRGWDRSLTAGKELEKPVAGSGRASFPPQPLPPPPQLLLLPAAAPGAALSPLFGDREDRSGLNERFCVTTT